MFVCGRVLRCAGTDKTRFESGPVTADLTTTVVHNFKLLINDVKPDHSLTFFNEIRLHLQNLKEINSNITSPIICLCYCRKTITLSVLSTCSNTFKVHVKSCPSC